jgi:hypothetical protein
LGEPNIRKLPGEFSRRRQLFHIGNAIDPHGLRPQKVFGENQCDTAREGAGCYQDFWPLNQQYFQQLKRQDYEPEPVPSAHVPKGIEAMPWDISLIFRVNASKDDVQMFESRLQSLHFDPMSAA